MASTYRPARIVAPYPITYTFKVKQAFAGSSLLELMSTRFPFHGSKEWKLRIQNGQVGVNGKSVDPNYPLQLLDQVFHHNPAMKEPSVPDEVTILEEHDDYLVVYKPAPMPVHPGGRYNKNSLTAILEDMGYRNIKVVHRLDAVTSGLMLFARNKEASARAMQCFSNGKVRKTYYALVEGVPIEESVTINASIRRRKGFVFESGEQLTKAKQATTHFKVLMKGSAMSIIQCRPLTGRTHQIRLHLEHWGYPIWDDPIYGPKGDKSSKSIPNCAIGLINAEMNIPDLNIRASLGIPASWKEWLQQPDKLPVYTD